MQATTHSLHALATSQEAMSTTNANILLLAPAQRRRELARRLRLEEALGAHEGRLVLVAPPRALELQAPRLRRARVQHALEAQRALGGEDLRPRAVAQDLVALDLAVELGELLRGAPLADEEGVDLDVAVALDLLL